MRLHQKQDPGEGGGGFSNANESRERRRGGQEGPVEKKKGGELDPGGHGKGALRKDYLKEKTARRCITDWTTGE